MLFGGPANQIISNITMVVAMAMAMAMAINKDISTWHELFGADEASEEQGRLLSREYRSSASGAPEPK